MNLRAKHITPLPLALLACVAGCGGEPQLRWTELHPTTSPAARNGMQVAGDDRTLYVFGGSSGPDTHFNDLWAYRDHDWVELSADGAAGSPPRRGSGRACFDFARDQLVIFGGRDTAGELLGDTWVFSSGKWVEKTPALAPGKRRWPAMAYDWKNEQVLLFGGNDGKNLNDTWAWDGTTWRELSPRTRPPIKSRPGIVSMRRSRQILMYGGSTQLGVFGPMVDLWLWDGNDWTKRLQDGGPDSMLAGGMACDEEHDLVVCFGGHNRKPRADTYVWNGDGWTKFEGEGPRQRSGHAMGYVRALGQTIVFGGFPGKLPMLGSTFAFGN